MIFSATIEGSVEALDDVAVTIIEGSTAECELVCLCISSIKSATYIRLMKIQKSNGK